MNLLINCSNLRVGGGLQVAHSFIHSLRGVEGHKFIIVVSTELSELYLPESGSNLEIIRYDIIPSVFKSLSGRDTFLDSLLVEHSVDRVFTVFGPSYWRPRVFHLVGYAKPHYVYEDSPFFKTLDLKEKLKLFLKKQIHINDFRRNSDSLVTENQDVSEKIQKYFQYLDIHTVTNFYNQVFDHPELWSNDVLMDDYRGFSILTISANYPHKNLHILIAVADYLKTNIPELECRFILTVSKEQFKKEIHPDLKHYFVFLGKVTIDQCPNLYRKADLTLLPTLLECFTATYPESMRMFVPILTTDLGFARGICGDAAIYFDPLNPQDIAKKIEKVLMSERLKKQLIENGKKRLGTFDNYKERSNKYIQILTS